MTPYGDIVVSSLRGAWMGNRGCIHDGFDIVRPWNGRRWIICKLQYKGWVAPKWEPGRWTALFFQDEAVALAAGHRPCALCRRDDYVRYRDSINATGADDIDLRLHHDRLDGRAKRTHRRAWTGLPAGAFVELDGAPALIRGDAVVPWSPDVGYAAPRVRPASGDAVVLTPSASVDAILAGYPVQFAT
ncbi:MAG TPA: hypothetical protein VFV00_18630 [Acidimicrobiales bacterium]|nr:hypothetical protein [Acidimicrobiales bacterium]